MTKQNHDSKLNANIGMKFDFTRVKNLKNGFAEVELDFDDEFISSFEKKTGKTFCQNNLQEYVIQTIQDLIDETDK